MSLLDAQSGEFMEKIIKVSKGKPEKLSIIYQSLCWLINKGLIFQLLLSGKFWGKYHNLKMEFLFGLNF